ncbi:MAG: biotin transporter BioY [Eubacterium sp.]|nr:biotin transporter BioY [Eubacterium sp.]
MITEKIQNRTGRLAMAALFTALVAVGAFIKIPMPFMDYFTLQFFFVILSGIVLGSKLGALSLSLYLILGLVGVPVFAGGGGFNYVLMPTFGYIISFIFASYAIGYITERGKPSLKRYFSATLVGFVLIYAIGITYKLLILLCYIHTDKAVSVILLSSLSIQMPFDIFLCFVVANVGLRLRKIVFKSMA